MGERSDEIEGYIEQKRSELGDNLTELEERVKRAVNWRAQVSEHPMTSVAIAFAGGIILSSLGGRARRVQNAADSPQAPSQEAWSGATSAPVSSQRRPRHSQKAQALDAWDNIKDALVGVAATKVVSFLDRALPGFQSEFRRAEQKRSAWSSFDSSSSSPEPNEYGKPH